jgi:hypothetical protein
MFIFTHVHYARLFHHGLSEGALVDFGEHIHTTAMTEYDDGARTPIASWRIAQASAEFFGVRTTGGGYKLFSECNNLGVNQAPLLNTKSHMPQSWLTDSDPECVARHDHEFHSLAHSLIKRYQTGSSWPKLKMQIRDKLGGVLANLQKAAWEAIGIGVFRHSCARPHASIVIHVPAEAPCSQCKTPKIPVPPSPS